MGSNKNTKNMAISSGSNETVAMANNETVGNVLNKNNKNANLSIGPMAAKIYDDGNLYATGNIPRAKGKYVYPYYILNYNGKETLYYTGDETLNSYANKQNARKAATDIGTTLGKEIAKNRTTNGKNNTDTKDAIARARAMYFQLGNNEKALAIKVAKDTVKQENGTISNAERQLIHGIFGSKLL